MERRRWEQGKSMLFRVSSGEPPAGWLNIDHKQHPAREKHPAPFNGEARWYLRPTKEGNVAPSVAGAELSTLGWVG